MKFSQKLIDETIVYLAKKTGVKPDKGVTEVYLKSLSELGKMFMENVENIQNEANSFKSN